MTGQGRSRLDRRHLSTYVVLDAATPSPGRTLPGLARAAVAGGARTLQIRDKHAGGRDLFELVARVVEAVSDAAEVILLVNDRVDVAAAARLAGLPVAGAHIGQGDLPAVAARAVLGLDAVLGLSVGSAAQVAAAQALPAGTVDYLGISPVRVTATKPDADLPVGPDGTVALAAVTTLPCVGIGGVTAADAAWMHAGGLAGMAVVSAVSLAADPEEATRELSTAWLSAARSRVVAPSPAATR